MKKTAKLFYTAVFNTQGQMHVRWSSQWQGGNDLFGQRAVAAPKFLTIRSSGKLYVETTQHCHVRASTNCLLNKKKLKKGNSSTYNFPDSPKKKKKKTTN